MVDDGVYPFYTCAERPYRINQYAFDTEAILISGNGANLGYVNYYKGKFNAYQRTYVLDIFSENIQYIKYYLKANLGKRIDLQKNTGNTPYITLATLSEMPVSFPSQKVQRQIVDLFLEIENKYNNEINILSYLSCQKSFMLRSMFI